MAVAYADAEDAVEPVVLWRCRLEHRIDAEVVARGIDALTAIDPLQHIGGAVAQAPICHTDHGAVGGFQHQADVQSLPPSRTAPDSRSPSKTPPNTTPVRRTPVGVSPTTCSGRTLSLIANSGRAFI